ncbi:hypothetical protein [Streptomyces sp. NPDC088115]|uniref:hypothetical protein n=1 Tax=Streptomyces sp. NPDC088115 TaxID=3365824 RepID=UPI0038206F84
MIDADLSARAQGLLLRWLRRPPGAEIDDIGAMVKRSKREGKKRLEGRDALYKASYELEEEGFLVREQERSGSGQYEWVVRIYSSPVPLDGRSNPEDRKRTPRVRTASQNRRSTPVPENPELENQESADQESADQELSSKNSVNDSLSGDGRPSGDGLDQDEREAAAPEGKAVPAADGGDVPGPREDVDSSSGRPEVLVMLVSLPGGVSERAALPLLPLVDDAVTAGWTLDGLRAHLARLCDPERVRYAPAVYEKHLRELPAPPSASGAGAGAGRASVPEGMCVRHPAFREGDCSPCRRAEMNRQARGRSEPGPVDGMGLLARVRAGMPAGGAQ